jgi:hypothetical protein
MSSTKASYQPPVSDRTLMAPFRELVPSLTDHQAMANMIARGCFQSMLWFLAEQCNQSEIHKYVDESFLSWQVLTSHLDNVKAKRAPVIVDAAQRMMPDKELAALERKLFTHPVYGYLLKKERKAKRKGGEL